METDHLISGHLAALLQADGAACREAEIAHRSRARCYAEHIRMVEAARGTIIVSAGRS